MRKSNAELYDEISSIKIKDAPDITFSCASIEYYEACRLAFYYEGKGWLRRAISIWDETLLLNSNEICQQYGINGKTRCNRALTKLAESKARKEMA